MLKNLDQDSATAKITTSRRIVVLKSFLIGLAAGLLAVLFRLALEYAEEVRGALARFAAETGWVYLILVPLLFAATVAAVVFVTARFCPDAGGSGIPHLKGYLGGHNNFQPIKILAVKFFGGVLGIGSGLALGREGPTVQMGAAVAKLAGDRVSQTNVEKKILISAGAGAGLAAAFNAPMAGVFFVLEELHSSFHQVVLISAFVASVTADIVCRLMIGRMPVFHVRIAHFPELGMFPYFLLFGTAIGLIGLAFNLICAAVTKKLGVYYLVGAFIVGIVQQRVRAKVPALNSPSLLHSVEFFAGFFIPFYFFDAGLSLRPENFSMEAIKFGAILLVAVVPYRIISVAIHRRLVLCETLQDAMRTGSALLPTLVFTLVLAEILRERFSASPEIIGGLVVFTIVNTILPAIILRKRPELAAEGKVQ